MFSTLVYAIDAIYFFHIQELQHKNVKGVSGMCFDIFLLLNVKNGIRTVQTFSQKEFCLQ